MVPWWGMPNPLALAPAPSSLQCRRVHYIPLRQDWIGGLRLEGGGGRKVFFGCAGPCMH